MPCNRDLDRLEAIAKRAAAVPAWQPFSRCLELRAQGLRRASMEAARAFIASTGGWTHEEREAFVRWLSEEAEAMWDERLLMPHDLVVGLVAPTIRAWLSRQSDSSVAFYLSGKYCRGDEVDPLPLEAIRRSIALDPDFQPPRGVLVEWVTGQAEYNQHELPHYPYLGDVTEDIRDLVEAQAVLAGVRDSRWRESLADELNRLLEVACAWEAYSRSGGSDFAEWCRTHQVRLAAEDD